MDLEDGFQWVSLSYQILTFNPKKQLVIAIRSFFCFFFICTIFGFILKIQDFSSANTNEGVELTAIPQTQIKSTLTTFLAQRGTNKKEFKKKLREKNILVKGIDYDSETNKIIQFNITLISNLDHTNKSHSHAPNDCCFLLFRQKQREKTIEKFNSTEC